LVLCVAFALQLRCKPFVEGDQDTLETIQLVATLVLLLVVGSSSLLWGGEYSQAAGG
jgi:hypothetical protein